MELFYNGYYYDLNEAQEKKQSSTKTVWPDDEESLKKAKAAFDKYFNSGEASKVIEAQKKQEQESANNSAVTALGSGEKDKTKHKEEKIEKEAAAVSRAANAVPGASANTTPENSRGNEKQQGGTEVKAIGSGNETETSSEQQDQEEETENLGKKIF